MDEDVEKEIVSQLEFEWGQEGGFLFDYRDAKFNEEAFMRAYKNILRIDFRGEKKVSKKLVALIYSIPFFLICNEEAVIARGGSRMLCEKAIGDFSELVADKLGTQ